MSSRDSGADSAEGEPGSRAQGEEPSPPGSGPAGSAPAGSGPAGSAPAGPAPAASPIADPGTNPDAAGARPGRIAEGAELTSLELIKLPGADLAITDRDGQSMEVVLAGAQTAGHVVQLINRAADLNDQ